MKKFAFSALLIFALTTYAYGTGSDGHIGPTTVDYGRIVTEDPSSVSGSKIAAPEPTTILLLGAGALSLIALRRKLGR